MVSLSQGVGFVEINLHHCFDANDALSKYALDNNVQFFLCQDPYTSGGRVAGVYPDWLSFPSLNNTAVIFCTNRAMNCVISLRTANIIFITVVFKQISIVLRSVYSTLLVTLMQTCQAGLIIL